MQFTLHLGNEVFAFWRQSNDRSQSIFCIHNVTNKRIKIPLSMVNLIANESWHNLLTGKRYDKRGAKIKLDPYEFIWITNRG